MNTGIGGLVYKEPPEKNNNWLLNHKTFVNARSAIKYLFDHLKPKKIWLPSYLCKTIIQGNHNFKFYDCDIFDDPSKYFHLANEEGNIFYYIEYFGFRKNVNFKNKKCIVVQDCSQSIFLKKNTYADYAVYSFTKMLPVPDGGSIVGEINPVYDNPCSKILKPVDDLKKSIELRRKGDINWRTLYLKSKKNKPIGTYQMSDYSRKIINKIDFESLSKKFRKNYSFISSELPSLFGLENNVPLGFPVLAKNRDFLLKCLIEKKVYPAIHWKLPNYFKKASCLEKKIITIPCAWCCGDEIKYLLSELKSLSSNKTF